MSSFVTPPPVAAGRRPTQNRRRAGPRLSHPLSGADIATLARVLADAGPIPLNRWPHLAAVCGSVLGRMPFTLGERAAVAWRRRHPVDDRPPIFILGHWRSGTTHLYNILAKSRQFGFVSPLAAGMPWELLGLVRLIRPLLERALPEDRFIDNIPVEPDSPQEDEIGLANMTPLSFYHALYFPARFDRLFDRGLFFDGCSDAQIAAWQDRFRYFLDKLSLDQGGRRMLIKNPVYTGRVAMLRDLYPTAQFIHIHRNPFDVFLSTRNFYRKLFAELALQPYGHVPVDDVILRTYRRMMKALVDDTADLPANRFVEIGYDDLDADPIGTVASLYERFGWDGWETAEPRFRSYLGTVRSYQKNAYSYDPEARQKVAGAWQPFIDRWGYAAPD